MRLEKRIKDDPLLSIMRLGDYKLLPKVTQWIIGLGFDSGFANSKAEAISIL